MGNLDTSELDRVLRAMEGSGRFRTPRRVPRAKDDDSAALEGEIVVSGREATLRLVLDASFPLGLPRFFLRPWDALGVIPHVDQGGLVCYADREGLLLDRRRPVAVVERAFDLAVGVLADGIAGHNRADFADEWESYWRQLQGSVETRSVLEPVGNARWALVATGKEGAPWIAGDEGDIAAFLNESQIGGTLTLQRALYLPLAPDPPPNPPRHDRPFWTAEDARAALLPSVADADRRRLAKLLKGRTRSREYVVVGLARPSGGTTLFGIRFDGVGARHPLLEGGTAERVVPLQLERLDRSYLVPRGGGEATLGAKRVLLVGCGAIGGNLAFEIVRAGVLNVTVVDPDVLTPENTFRHVLGRRHWWRRKAEALKGELEAELPYVQVRAMTETIERALADGTVDLADYDLIVLALGNPTVELAINERLHQLPGAPPAIFTWLEPLGIGGHALLVGNADSGGCFECLYTPLDDDTALESRAAFAAPGQSFGRALSGCGSLFTPYGSADAARTAALAARLVVDTMSGKEAGNPLLSWKGDASAFEGAGFRLSPRYGFTEDDLHRLRYAYRTARCQICGERAAGIRQ